MTCYIVNYKSDSLSNLLERITEFKDLFYCKLRAVKINESEDHKDQNWAEHDNTWKKIV